MDKLSFVPVMGTEQKITAQDLRPGHVYFSTDTKRIYMDADTRLMMGGNSGIHYGKYQPEEEISDEVTDFEFTSNDLEKPDEIPNVNDLILNIPDGCFYRVIEDVYKLRNTNTLIKLSNLQGALKELANIYNVKIEVYMSRGQGAPTKYYITYIVKTPVVKLTWDYNQATLNSLENDFVLNDWSFSGEGQNKKLHIILNDYQEIDTLPMGDKVDVLNYSFNPIEKSISHGVYKLEIYGSLEINGQYVETEHISYQVIFYDKNNKATIVSCLLTDYNLTQYTSINIPYVIYYPNNTVEGSATVELIENNDEENKVVLDGLYSWDEYKILDEEFKKQLVTIAIVCDKKIRYSRLKNREVRPLTNSQARDRDLSEIENIAKAPPITYADYYIFNNGTLEDYEKRLNEILKQI